MDEDQILNPSEQLACILDLQDQILNLKVQLSFEDSQAVINSKDEEISVLRELLLLTHPAVSDVIMNDITQRQYEALNKEFPTERGNKPNGFSGFNMKRRILHLLLKVWETSPGVDLGDLVQNISDSALPRDVNGSPYHQYANNASMLGHLETLLQLKGDNND